MKRDGDGCGEIDDRRTRRVLHYVLAIALFAGGCSRNPASPPEPATRETVWAAIQPLAARYRMDPAFIYALVAAESNFNPRARQGEARGLMQLKPPAWREVSREPYESAVWDWRKNLEAGVDYLAWCRSYLHRKNRFSYPLLLAAFHYGIDYVEQHGFDSRQIPVPDNPVYRELWQGRLAPVALPK
jgi:soluble lytic murein transglycosylase-like protein